jgi:hypothetical protein
LCIRCTYVAYSLFPCVSHRFGIWLICSTANPAPVDMNWTCVVYGGPMFLATLWFVVDAHKWFTGPRVTLYLTFLANNRSMLHIVCWVTKETFLKERTPQIVAVSQLKTQRRCKVVVISDFMSLCIYLSIGNRSF